MTEIRFPKPARRSGKPKRRIASKSKRKAGLHEADRLFSQLIRTRDGWACRACQSHMHPQCAHIISRRYRAGGLRWNPLNAVCLCRRCHLKYTYDPIGWELWVEERFPGRLALLKAQAMSGAPRPDYTSICAKLKSAVP